MGVRAIADAESLLQEVLDGDHAYWVDDPGFLLLKRLLEAEKKKAETPAKESRPCSHSTCDYEVGGRWSCEYVKEYKSHRDFPRPWCACSLCC